MTKLEAIKSLEEHDHAFLSPEYAKEVAKIFGMKPFLQKMRDNRSKFKGLTLSGVNPETGKEYQEGEYAEGIEAHSLACQIADHLKVEYAPMFGIGSQLRSACGAILKHLEVVKV